MRGVGVGLIMFDLGSTISVAGLALILFSLLSRSHRGAPAGNGFWAPKESFTSTEYAADRVGFALVLAGILIMLASLW